MNLEDFENIYGIKTDNIKEEFNKNKNLEFYYNLRYSIHHHQRVNRPRVTISQQLHSFLSTQALNFAKKMKPVVATRISLASLLSIKKLSLSKVLQVW